ncbi:hypothetical protein U1Q18_047363, partial [Sarracenia purpurea var. burkii]
MSMVISELVVGNGGGSDDLVMVMTITVVVGSGINSDEEQNQCSIKDAFSPENHSLSASSASAGSPLSLSTNNQVEVSILAAAAVSAAAIAANGVKMATSSQAYLEGNPVRESKVLISELCRQFYNLGWVSGTGGSITVKVHDDSIPKPHQLIVMSPSGVQKERMVPEDMYVLSPSGSILSHPLSKPYPHKPPKCSDCGPLFMKAYEMCNAGAVIHSHGMESCLVTMINPLSKEFR